MRSRLRAAPGGPVQGGRKSRSFGVRDIRLKFKYCHLPLGLDKTTVTHLLGAQYRVASKESSFLIFRFKNFSDFSIFYFGGWEWGVNSPFTRNYSRDRRK